MKTNISKKNIFSRKKYLCNDLIILDGLTGTGKTMLTPIISSLHNIQNARFENVFENICIAKKYNKITDDAFNSIISILIDIKYYDSYISREINFRPSDLSSVFQTSKWPRYLKQLFMNDGIEVEKRIRHNKEKIFFVTHQLLSCFEPLFNILKQNIKIIETIRHPIYLIDHWTSYINMHGNNPRDFTVWINKNNLSLPWFAQGWESKYINSKNIDKVIYSIDFLYKELFKFHSNSFYKKNILFLSFEDFVINSEKNVKKLLNFLNTKKSSGTNKILSNQKLPRININDGPQKSIYKKYGVKKYMKISHEQDYNLRLKKIKKRCSKECFLVFKKNCKLYEDNFGIWF